MFIIHGSARYGYDEDLFIEKKVFHTFAEAYARLEEKYQEYLSEYEEECEENEANLDDMYQATIDSHPEDNFAYFNIVSCDGESGVFSRIDEIKN